MPTLTEDFKLDTKEGRRKFYDVLATQKDILKNNFCIDMPSFEEYEKECSEKMELNKAALERKERFQDVRKRFLLKNYNKDFKNDRISYYFLKTDGDDADIYNDNIMKEISKDRTVYANKIAEKLLGIDTKDIIARMQGKTDEELAKMYLENPEPFDFGWIVKDFLGEYKKEIKPELYKQINDRRLEYQNLGIPRQCIENVQLELYVYLPAIKKAEPTKFNPKPFNLKFEEGHDAVERDIVNAFLNMGMAKMKRFQNIEADYKTIVKSKVADLMQACKYSEENSKINSKYYKDMKKALEKFDAKCVHDKDIPKDVVEELKTAATEYLKYKSGCTMKKNAEGKVAAADGILELVEEVSKHETYTFSKVKSFEKFTDENSYTTRANSAFEQAKKDYGVKEKEKMRFSDLENEGETKEVEKTSKIVSEQIVENVKEK